MNNCCVIEVDEPSVILSDRIVRAKKRHDCCECGATIEAGRLYSVEATVGPDGDFETFKTCARCRNVRDEYFPSGWVWSRLADDFQECYDFDYRDGIPADFAPCRGRKDEHGER